MPRTLSEFIDDLVSGVASAINLVTNFVDKALKDIENLVASANRAIGLIKNARATIARFSRRIGALQLSVANLASGISFDGFKTAAQLNNAAHVKKVKNNYLNLAKLLAVLQARFASLARTIPLRRHLVKKDETLQALAIKYYNNADLWKTIYDHNKLSTPQLVVGSVLEIPRA
jgi:nucleoid-associated protein YgaU